ncbi:TfoX/Sxy family protein [Uliginosibacterium sp. 31-16]|uniref:TfoX/Sxy family protein n=1 Tax=Uliginosibacterium sp. 31-16 TaxID=3068315 RepID=UPI00273E97D9|nr:TfoX/Sxy family protein [Uliginosibacterium sp. 31-16]MDP5238440.1 TfoX/Sxy family protein [Uliginosibacterium sp. 31-16]
MSASAEYLAYLAELLAPLGRIRTKRMFGGAGIYCEELFFAIVIDDVLYLKVDDESRAAFEAEGLEPFRYEAKGKLMQMNYYRAPDEALESPALMQPWARDALAAALRARK